MTRFLTPFNTTVSPRTSRWGNTSADELFGTMLSDFFGNTAATPAKIFSTQKTDIWEEDGHFKVAMDVPGLTEKDLDITVHNGVLTLKAETTDATTDEGKTFICRERSSISFERQIALPEGIDEDKVAASLNHGVLTISMPKLETETKKVHKVRITNGK